MHALRSGALLLIVSVLPAQTFDLAGIPSEIAAHEGLVVARCSTCHTMSRVVKARHVGGEWADVVEDMRLREKSGISVPESEKITAFLAAWSRRGEAARAEMAAPVPALPSAGAGIGAQPTRRITLRSWKLTEGMQVADVPSAVGNLKVESLRFEMLGAHWSPVAMLASSRGSSASEVRPVIPEVRQPPGVELHRWSIDRHQFHLEPSLEVVGTEPLTTPDPSRIRLVLSVVHTLPNPSIPKLAISSP